MSVAAGVNIYNGKIEKDLIGVVIVILLILASLPILLMYAYYHDTFKYKNGEFMCSRVLHKTKRWDIIDVLYVKVIPFRGEMIIQFFDKNNKLIVRATDSKSVWDDGRLRKLLYFYNIPIQGKLDY